MDKPSQLIAKGDVFFHYFRREANAEAQRLYREAIALDPSLSQPYADLAYAQLTAWLYYWDPAMKDLSEARFNAEKALENARLRNEDEYYAQWMLADVCLYCKDFSAASSAYDTALGLASTQAVAEEQRAMQVDHADMLLLTGNAQQAISLVTAAIESSPLPERWFYWVLGWAYYVDEQYENSLQAMRKLGKPRNAMRKNMIANFVALGRGDEAEAEVQTFLAEEAAQGIVYSDKPGGPVWPKLQEVEQRVPFEDFARSSRWLNDLGAAFDKPES